MTLPTLENIMKSKSLHLNSNPTIIKSVGNFKSELKVVDNMIYNVNESSVIDQQVTMFSLETEKK
jgi:hypothetical protein